MGICCTAQNPPTEARAEASRTRFQKRSLRSPIVEKLTRFETELVDRAWDSSIVEKLTRSELYGPGGSGIVLEPGSRIWVRGIPLDPGVVSLICHVFTHLNS